MKIGQEILGMEGLSNGLFLPLRLFITLRSLQRCMDATPSGS